MSVHTLGLDTKPYQSNPKPYQSNPKHNTRSFFTAACQGVRVLWATQQLPKPCQVSPTGMLGLNNNKHTHKKKLRAKACAHIATSWAPVTKGSGRQEERVQMHISSKTIIKMGRAWETNKGRAPCSSNSLGGITGSKNPGYAGPRDKETRERYQPGVTPKCSHHTMRRFDLPSQTVPNVAMPRLISSTRKQDGYGSTSTLVSQAHLQTQHTTHHTSSSSPIINAAAAGQFTLALITHMHVCVSCRHLDFCRHTAPFIIRLCITQHTTWLAMQSCQTLEPGVLHPISPAKGYGPKDETQTHTKSSYSMQ